MDWSSRQWTRGVKTLFFILCINLRGTDLSEGGQEGVCCCGSIEQTIIRVLQRSQMRCNSRLSDSIKKNLDEANRSVLSPM